MSSYVPQYLCSSRAFSQIVFKVESMEEKIEHVPVSFIRSNSRRSDARLLRLQIVLIINGSWSLLYRGSIMLKSSTGTSCSIMTITKVQKLFFDSIKIFL